MLIRVDPALATPIYEQIALAIKREIDAGRLDEGDRLPSARRLSEALGVNMHTVLRAYRALADEGVAHLGRGRAGAVVGHSAIREAGLVATVVADAKRRGLSLEAFLVEIREAW